MPKSGRLSQSRPGEYQLGERLYVGFTSIIYRARRIKDSRSVIIKALNNPGLEAFEQFEREYEITYGLHALSSAEPGLDGVIDIYALETVQHRLAMVLEDFGGESLTRLHLAGRLDLVEFLHLAIKITECLNRIHQYHLIHKNITPSNIVVNQATEIVKLIDFGIAAAISPEPITLPRSTLLEGTLAYLSPEQSGRVHRDVDHRSDLYSLGATLYELLTGHVPFDEQDTLELVYSHLVRRPTSPHEMNPSIPKPLADMMLKLLDKDPDHRYQTASGLKADLEICLQQWNSRDTILPFPLAAHDVRDRFTTPQQLYDRERETKQGTVASLTELKTAQALSSEVRLDELLKKLLRFVLENAGAEKGVLLLEEQGRWVIGAIGRPDHVETYLGQPQHLEDTEEAPAEVVHYVEHTRAALVLTDASNAGYFTQAPYIIRHQCRSVIALPLLNQGRLISILYLENSLIPGAFTEDRMGLLRWLSSQMAISIDNARLYQQLEQKVEERTRALKEEIAERERVEQALRRQEHLFRTLVEHSPDIIARYDRNLRHLYMSPTIEAVTGRTAQEYIGRTHAEMGMPEQSYQLLDRALRNVFETGRSDRLVEFDYPAPDQTHEYRSRLIPEFAEDSSVISVLSITSDITEQKWTEQALRESIELAETAQQEAEMAERKEEKRRQEAERRRQIAESLRDIVSILNSNHPLDEVLDYILSQARSMLGNQASAVYCASGKNGEVIVQAAQGLSGDYLANAMRSIAHHNLEHTPLIPWPITIPDIAAIDASQDDSSQGVQGLLMLAPSVDAYRALLAVPILIKDEIYGCLQLYYRDPHAFSDEETELAIMFSDQIALAIETARLREQAKQAAVLDERNRLARDLHDSVTQTIFSANLIAETLPRIWESHPEEGQCGLHELHRLIQGALAEMRTLLLELRPAAIVEKKLGELLKQLTQTAASQTRAAIAVTVEGDRTLPAEVQIAFYRIAQEALNNIIKHARASYIVVQLYANTDSVVLRVSDNGCGFDVSAIPPDHLGVGIMRERAVSIGATFALTSQAGHGAEVLITWREPTGGQAHG